MTQEEKQLLLQDLCARLPYRVMIKSVGENKIIGLYDLKDVDNLPLPYLRPMSSMTEEEREHLQTLHDIISDENYGDGFSPTAWGAILDFNNYCREHHLDNGGLITLGLALEAPEGMYK